MKSSCAVQVLLISLAESEGNCGFPSSLHLNRDVLVTECDRVCNCLGRHCVCVKIGVKVRDNRK